jgi:hypothetical protein
MATVLWKPRVPWGDIGERLEAGGRPRPVVPANTGRSGGWRAADVTVGMVRVCSTVMF